MNKIYLPLLLTVVFSCDKTQDSPKDYSGTYDCLVYGSSFNIFDSTTWGAAGPPTQSTLDVVQNGSLITVDNDFTFHCDSIVLKQRGVIRGIIL